MRHGRRSQRLSRVRDQRDALVGGLVKGLVTHDRIRTTHARAKEAQRVADRLVTFGKDGSIYARQRAYRILQNRALVRRLFAEIAPRFVDCSGGYTRVVRVGIRRGDGAQEAVLAFSRLPAMEPTVTAAAKAPTAPSAPSVRSKPESSAKVLEKKPKKFLEGLRSLWTRKS